MCFVDELILYSRGDFVSIHLLLQCFKLFSDSSGLQANINKYSFYVCGMKETDDQMKKDISGYSGGLLLGRVGAWPPITV